MTVDSVSDLLEFSRRLSAATDLASLLVEAQRAILHRLGLQQVWLGFVEGDGYDRFRMMIVDGSLTAAAATQAVVLHTKGDAMLEELVRTEMPVVVFDARTDPRTDKKMVETFGNRSIVNMPLRLLDRPLGILGTGTFGDEGCRTFSDDELSYLTQLASHLSVAAGRIRLIDEQQARERERLELSRRLQQAQRLEGIGLLTAGVAHDFNNLLTVIMGAADMLRREPLSQAQDDQLNMLLAAGERAVELVKQLLTMGLQSAPKLSVMDTNQHVAKLLELIKHLLPSNIEVVLQGGADVPRVRADGSQLDQVLMNLCLNARDAMPDGGRLTLLTECVTLSEGELTLEPRASPGTYVHIRVVDTGTGMTPEVSARIFEPFFTTKAQGKGTGLGLSVAHGIVRSRGGLLRCQSQLGVGTTFEIYLPAHERVASPTPTPGD